MAYTIVQSRSQQFSATGTASLAFASAITAGNTLIAVIGTYSGSIGTTAITDNRSGANTWTQAVATVTDAAAFLRLSFFRCDNAASGATTVTYSGGTSGTEPTLAIYEISGLDSAGSFDKGASNTAASGASHITGTTAATTVANELVLIASGHGGATSTPTATGFTAGQIQSNATNNPLGTFHKRVTTTGTQSGTISWQNANWVAGIATFKESAGSGPTPISGSDASTLTAAETGAIARSATATDTAPLLSSETGAIARSATATDTAPLLSSETGAIDRRTTALDTAPITSAELGSLATSDATAATDTAPITSTELGTVTSVTAQAGTDTAAIASAEIATSAATVAAPDPASLTGAETVAIARSAIPPDTGTLTAAETGTISSTLSAADASTLTAAESGAIARSATTPDTAAIASAESATVQGVALLTVPDTASISSSESAGRTSIDVVLATDTGTLSLADVATLSAQAITADSAQITSAEAATIVVTLTAMDTAPITSNDAWSVIAAVRVTDTAALGSTHLAAVIDQGAPLPITALRAVRVQARSLSVAVAARSRLVTHQARSFRARGNR